MLYCYIDASDIFDRKQVFFMRTDPSLHYLDNAATTLMDPAVADVIHQAMLDHWANPSSLYGPGAESEDALHKARAALAHTLGCKSREWYFTSCGSEGNNLALLGGVRTKTFGKKIVCSGFEHPSVRRPLEDLASAGWQVVFVPPHADGSFAVDEMLSQIDRSTVLAACMMVNNETGAVCDVARLAREVKKINSRMMVHVDGVQAWMRLPVRLADSGIDSFTVSGHKIHAPKGVGGLYLSDKLIQSFRPPYLGGEQERGIRPGTENLPYALGLAAAAQKLAPTLGQRAAQARALNQRLRQGLAAFPTVEINSPDGAVPEILNFSENKVRSETMLAWLAQEKIYVSSASACGRGEPSHTLAAMGRPARAVDTAIRVSFCADNTESDVDAFLERFEAGMKTLQGI